MKTLTGRLRLLAIAAGAAVLLGALLVGPGTRTPATESGSWTVPALAAAAAAGFWWWRRRSGRALAIRDQGLLRCLEKARLEPGRTLHLVEVDGQRLLLSCAEGGIRLVARLRSAAAGARPVGEKEGAS